MIGGRPALIGLTVVALLGGVIGQRDADPMGADPPGAVDAERALRRRAQDADIALASLAERLMVALAAGRRGAGRTVAGTASPSGQLEQAATDVADAAGALSATSDALAALRGAAEVAGVASVPPAPVTPDELASIAAQLRASAEPAADLAAHRMEAETVVAALGDALAALDTDDPEAAAAAIERGMAAHAAVVAWEAQLVTLPIWIETSGLLLGALGDLAAATLAGDAAAARDAADRYAAAADEGRRADQALGIALAEGGAAITDVPLRRLAAVLERIDDARAALVPILHPDGSPAE